MQPDTENLRRAADRLERLDSLWRESLLKINEVRTELGRAGFPVDEGAWPTEQLRALVNAYLSDGGSCGPIVSAAHDILNKSGIAHGGLVDRVTELRRRRDLLDIENNNLRDAHTKLFTQRADLSRRLDASERDRVGLLATLETVRGERNVHSLTAQRCHAALTEARVRDGALNDRVKALIAERDDARAKVRALDEERAGLARCLEQAKDERDALRPKPTGPAVEWRGRGGCDLFVNGEFASQVCVGLDGKPWRLLSGTGWIGHATSEESARKLAELLANHDPGGRWTVAGHTVPVDVVRAVCGTVAVGWAP